jgi:hypothetical protein
MIIHVPHPTLLILGALCVILYAYEYFSTKPKTINQPSTKPQPGAIKMPKQYVPIEPVISAAIIDKIVVTYSATLDDGTVVPVTDLQAIGDAVLFDPTGAVIKFDAAADFALRYKLA